MHAHLRRIDHVARRRNLPLQICVIRLYSVDFLNFSFLSLMLVNIVITVKCTGLTAHAYLYRVLNDANGEKARPPTKLLPGQSNNLLYIYIKHFFVHKKSARASAVQCQRSDTLKPKSEIQTKLAWTQCTRRCSRLDERCTHFRNYRFMRQ